MGNQVVAYTSFFCSLIFFWFSIRAWWRSNQLEAEQLQANAVANAQQSRIANFVAPSRLMCFLVASFADTPPAFFIFSLVRLLVYGRWGAILIDLLSFFPITFVTMRIYGRIGWKAAYEEIEMSFRDGVLLFFALACLFGGIAYTFAIDMSIPV